MKPLSAPHIASLVPYPPGKPVDEVKRELGIEGSIIKLASNENPLGPSPKAVRALMEGLSELHRYPDGGGYYLKQKLASTLGVLPSRIMLGNGSNELIELLIRAFVGPSENVVISATTFVVYKLVLKAAGRDFVEVPTRGYAYDLDRMADAVNEHTKMVFIASPNNPTGLHVGRDALEKLLGRLPEDVVVVMDEAYFEYATAEDYPDTLAIQDGAPRLVTLRTFSKAYGLAGLRCGYGVGAEQLVGLVNRVRQPFNCSALAQLAALAALDDSEHLERSRECNRVGMARLSEGIAALGCSVVPSQANFLLIDLGRPSKPVFQAMLREGVIVRPMDGYGLPSCLRITVGTQAENSRCLETLATVLRA